MSTRMQAALGLALLLTGVLGLAFLGFWLSGGREEGTTGETMRSVMDEMQHPSAAVPMHGAKGAEEMMRNMPPGSMEEMMRNMPPGSMEEMMRNMPSGSMEEMMRFMMGG